VEKKADKMTLETAQKAVSLFVKGKEEGFLVRLLGGEPLLSFSVAKDVIDFGLANYPKIKFDLTTNGFLLDKKVADFFFKRERAELILSSCQADIIRLKKLSDSFDLSFITINFNLLPQSIGQCFNFFEKMVALGFRRFNFLPAFYFPWRKKEIEGLQKFLQKISLFIEVQTIPVKIKNLEYSSKVPLYNLAPTIDCQGGIYAGDFFLDARFEPLKSILKLGNIYKLKSSNEIFDLPLEIDINLLLSRAFSADILTANKMVYEKISDFCRQFKNNILI